MNDVGMYEICLMICIFLYNFEKTTPIVHQKPNKCKCSKKIHIREDCLSNVSAGRRHSRIFG